MVPISITADAMPLQLRATMVTSYSVNGCKVTLTIGEVILGNTRIISGINEIS